MAFVTTAIAAVGSAFGSVTLAGVARGLLTSVAISALSAALAPTPQAAGLRTEETLTGDLAPAAFILGRFATAGSAICPALSHGQIGKTPNAYLTYVIALADRPGHQLERIWIDGEEAQITATVETENGYGHELGGEFAGRGWIKYYDGTQTAADPMLLAKYGADPDRPWQADMVGAGLCYAILTFRYDREVYNTFPAVRFVLSGAPLYDPRRDSTAGGSGTQRWTSPATWTQTDNPVVMIYNILRGITLAPGRVWGPGLAAGDLRAADWFGAMNVCDQEVAVAGGGTRPRYRAGWEVRATDEPAAVIEELLKTCSGDIADMGGTWRIRAGGPGLPSYILTDDDLLISRPEQFTPFPPVEQIFNAISVTYPGPAMLYETKESPTRRNAAWEAEDGGRYLPVTLDLPACPYFRQAQQVGQEMIRDHRRMRAHGFSLGHPAAKLELLDVISWTSARNGYVAKAFDLREKQEDAFSATAAWTAREKNAADYDWQATDELPDPVPSAVIRRPVAQSVPGFVVQGIAHDDGTGKPRRPAIRLSWDGEAIEDAVAIEWEMRRVGKTAVGWRGSMRAVEAGERILSGGIVANVAYEARMRPAFANRKRAWTAWQQASAPAVFVQPEDFGVGETAFEAWMRARGITPVLQVTTLPTVPPADPNDLVNFGGEVYRWDGSAWTKGVEVTDLTGEISDTAIFAQSIRPPEVVATLPTTGNWEGRMVLLTGTGQLYVWRGGAWQPLSVTRDLVNPVSTTGTLARWGGVGEDGAGGGGAAGSQVYDTANSALVLWSSGDLASRSDSFPVDHGKIYRVSAWLRKPSAAGQVYLGLSGFTVPTKGALANAVLSGTETFFPYNASRQAQAALTNFYFVSGAPASGDWIEHVCYIVGAHRDVMDCPAHKGPGARPFVKLSASIQHLALRLLNWANAGATNQLLMREVSVSEVTAGQIVAANLVDGAVTDAKIAGMAASKVTGQLTDAQIAAVAAAKVAGQLTSEQIADAAIGIAKFAAGLRPVEIVSALPTTGNFAGRVVFLETDGKIYRHDGTSFVASVPAADIAGQVQAAQIAALEAAKITGQLTDAQIAALSAAKLAGQITQTQITDGSISTGKLAAAAVIADKIASSAITADKVAANAITAAKISAGAVEAAKIAAGAVVAGKIGAGAVLAGTVAAGAITAGNLAADAVTAGTIAAGAISAREIAAGSITSGKLLVRNADNLVPNPDFATGDLASWYPWSGAANMSVVAANAAGVPAGAPSLNVCKFTASGGTVGIFSHESAYTEDGDGIAVAPGDQFLATIDVAAEADVTAPLHLIPWYRTVSRTNASNTFTCTPVAGAWTRYSFNITIPANVYKMHMYVRWNSSAGGPLYWTNLRVIRRNTGELIVDGAITANKIGAGEVVAGKIAAGAVVADNIAANAVTAAKISAGAVEAAKIAAGAVQADKIAAGAVLTDKLAANAVTAGKIAAGAVTADTIEAGAITVGKLNAGAVTAGTVAAGAIGAAEIAAGAITSGKLLVRNADNLVPNPDFATGDLASWNPWSGAANMSVVASNAAGVPAGAPSLNVCKFTASGGTVGLFSHESAYTADGDGIAVTPGDQFLVTIDVAAEAAVTAPLYLLSWYRTISRTNASNTFICTPVAGAWTRYSFNITIPANVYKMHMYVLWTSSAGGPLYWTNLRVIRRNAGELIVDGAISANHLNTTSLSVEGVGIFGGTLASSNYATGSAGWRITQAGDAEFNSLIVRRGMLDIGAAAIEASAYAGGTLTKTANAMVYGEDLLVTVTDPGLSGKQVWITYAAEVELTRSTIGYVEARFTLAGAVSLDTYRARVYIPVANGVLRLPFIATRRLIAPAGTSWQFSSQPHMENLPSGVTGSVKFAKRALILRANMDQ